MTPATEPWLIVVIVVGALEFVWIAVALVVDHRITTSARHRKKES